MYYTNHDPKNDSFISRNRSWNTIFLLYAVCFVHYYIVWIIFEFLSGPFLFVPLSIVLLLSQPTQVNREDLYQNHWKSYYWAPSKCISLNPRKMMVLYIMCNPRKLIIHIRINWLHRKMTWVCWYLWESPHFYGWRKLKEDMINRLFCSTSFTPYITFYSSIF